MLDLCCFADLIMGSFHAAVSGIWLNTASGYDQIFDGISTAVLTYLAHWHPGISLAVLCLPAYRL